jgi:hypothetical protein
LCHGKSEFANQLTGEILSKSATDVLNSTTQAAIFQTLLKRNFTFKINDGQIRKDRMKELQLFNEQYNAYHLIFTNGKPESGLSEKMLISRLERFERQMRFPNDKKRIELQSAITQIVHESHLKKWHEERYPDRYDLPS